MKRTLTLLGCLAATLSLNAQIIFQEDFDGIGGPTAGGAGTYTFPAGWLLRNVDNLAPDAQVSYVNDAWERREDFANNVADSAAFSTSWTSPVGIANDWMWTPLIGPLPANCILKWNAITYDPLYPDGYEVRIMTAAQGPPTGSNGVIGNQITNSTSIFSIAAENTTWTARQVSLAAYAGQSVYIAIRNNSNNMFVLLIDDVTVEVQVNHDAEVTVVDTVSAYTQVPLSQVTAMPLVANIRNNGLQAVTNVRLKVDVLNSSNTVVYTTTSAPQASLAAGGVATFNAGSFTPSANEDYVFRFNSLINEADQIAGNDTDFWAFSVFVNDSVYARDNSTVIGGLGIGAGNGGYLGQSFTVNTTTVLTSVTSYVTAGYTGRPYAQVIWSTLPNGTPNTIIGGTDTITYPDDSARVYTIDMAADLVLNPGTYVVTAIEFSGDSTVQLGQTADIFTNRTVWVNWPTTPLGGWGNVEAFGSQFARTLVLRPNFGPNCIISPPAASANNNTLASCGGCNDGEATASVSGGAAPFTYLWSNGDTGMVADSLLPGTYTVTITDANGCSDTASVLVNFTTGITEAAVNGIQVYPNPSNGEFALVYNFAGATDATITITNVLGETVFSAQEQGMLKGSYPVSLKGYAAGAYLVRVVTATGVQVVPVQVQ
ncbi:MAG: choice-of-anchor J domain-containing protein [Bacteroidetes bacterium]|nr:choice-of-anchor J domain-containing protein [Bacteroidota bacterium]